MFNFSYVVEVVEKFSTVRSMDNLPSTLRYVDNIEQTFHSPSRVNLLNQIRDVKLKRTGGGKLSFLK